MILVKEHITHFERGLDPRDAMNTGNVVERLKDRYENLLIQLKETKNRQNFFVDVSAEIPIRLSSFCGWGNVHHFFHEFHNDELDKFKKIINKYESQIS